MQVGRQIVTFRMLEQNGILLSCVWILGLVIGIFTTAIAQQISSLMGVAAERHVSIVSLIAVTILPLLLSAIAVFMKVPQFIFSIAFVKAWMVGLMLRVYILAFGPAGWVAGTLFAFSDIAMRIPLFIFWIRGLSGQTRRIYRDLIFCCLIAVFSALLDGTIIAPFIATLFQ